jgi:hypothetical protein
MPNDTPLDPVFTQGTVEIVGEMGRFQVPAITMPEVPGLAVTMCRFGLFEVTHVPTGRRMPGGRWERHGTALLDFAQWALLGRLLGIDYATASAEALGAALRAHAAHPVPFPGATATRGGITRPMTVAEWMQHQRAAATFSAVTGDFPWEAPDDAPDARAFKLLEPLCAARRAGQAAEVTHA